MHESEFKQSTFTLDPDEIGKWVWLKQWREKILPELEKARQAKTIGKALDAKIEIVVPQVQWQLSDSEMLRELVNVSALKITVGETDSLVSFQSRRPEMRALLALGNGHWQKSRASDNLWSLRQSGVANQILSNKSCRKFLSFDYLFLFNLAFSP